MCTYDYTPYTGCPDGHQHYYIQWVKCGVAVEKGRYCSVQDSHQVEQLRKLSANVLSCPLHGPIAVQQFILDLAPRPQEEERVPERERSRARSTARRGATSRGRTPKRVASDRDDEPPVRREVRKQRSRPRHAPEYSDSDSSSSFSARPRISSDRVKRVADQEPPPTRRMPRIAHRRSVSADLVAPPPPTALSMRHGRSEVSLPMRPEPEQQLEEPPVPATDARRKPSLDIPLATGAVGLPTSPDMHRRASVHRSKSEGLLRRSSVSSQPETIPPVPNSSVAAAAAAASTASTAGDSSPEQQHQETPFSSMPRRGRRPGSRSVRDRSVDTTMRRIDEHVAPEEQHVTNASAAGPAREMMTPETRRSSVTTSPEPQPIRTLPSQPHTLPDLRPRLDSLQIPQQREHPLRDAYSAPTATPPETDISSSHRSLRTRSKSFRHMSPARHRSPAPGPAPAPYHTIVPSRPNTNEDTASIRSTRSRRFEDQVAEGRKWAAAREHMPTATPVPAATMPSGPSGRVLAMTDVLAHMSEPNLALGATGARESVDSGYRSGHQTQRSWEGAAPRPGATPIVSATGGAVAGKGRNTLHKSPPLAQGQVQGVGLGLNGRPAPPPLNLSAAAVPPCALPVSLLSPGFRTDEDEVGPLGKGGKGSSRQKVGLRKKISGLLWDRGGQRVVGVEG
ncbi:hypothetical protein C8A05DRAFT_13643 [Staphylotrichum tortipilum]|uniref:Uncharacterized protein n=1 Tax=Staphylotrichum tortipilum TaxID=2831512 RepID=A0AAN6MR66_9PEZI|nr:hypothetical protein C8A05DRAFT_13643 [Staphylotrichum longicolle]